MKQRLNHETQQEAEQIQQQEHGGGTEFASVEEMLRWDAAHTEVPKELEAKILRAAAPAPKRMPWWKRLFS